MVFGKLVVVVVGRSRSLLLVPFSVVTIAYTFGTIGNLTWYQSMSFLVQSLSPPLYLPFKFPSVEPHLLKGSFSPHMRGNFRNMWLND